jgi:type IV pilus assembly protein PilX
MKRRPHFHKPARGFSLIVSLILLVLVTMLSLAAMRSVALESRMSASSLDRNLAFQGAETALREAETRAAAATAASFPGAGCNDGFCAEPAPGDLARWADEAFAGWRDAVAAVSSLATTPAAIVERNGEGENWIACGQEIPRQPNCRTPRFRVTGRSTAEGRASVLVQSDVATQ